MAFPETDGPSGEAWISYSDISGLRFANLLVFDIENGTQFSVNQKDTGLFDHVSLLTIYNRNVQILTQWQCKDGDCKLFTNVWSKLSDIIQFMNYVEVDMKCY